MNSAESYYILCDESDANGKLYSDFYGGVMVRASELNALEALLQFKKESLNLHGEVKWSKVSARYLSKYEELIYTFFTFMRNGSIKIRIMFRPKNLVPPNLSKEHADNRYFILYYQFIKGAFGIMHRPPTEGGFSIIPLFDQFPDTSEKARLFKAFISRLQNQPAFKKAGMRIDPRHITEIRSHDHVLLQCLDVVLGAMCFYLNEKHLEIDPISLKLGNKTIAKLALYEYILKNIRKSIPAFSAEINTPCKDWPLGLWEMPYRHWAFVPRGT